MIRNSLKYIYGSIVVQCLMYSIAQQCNVENFAVGVDLQPSSIDCPAAGENCEHLSNLYEHFGQEVEPKSLGTGNLYVADSVVLHAQGNSSVDPDTIQLQTYPTYEDLSAGFINGEIDLMFSYTEPNPITDAIANHASKIYRIPWPTGPGINAPCTGKCDCLPPEFFNAIKDAFVSGNNVPEEGE